jgi:hypothetical protein
MADMLLTITELDDCPIPAGCRQRLDEVTIKKYGCVWRINKNDSDPFPSNPHAHNCESGLKLDLSNGNLYFSAESTGKAVEQKRLLAIRTAAEQKGVKLPALAV